MAELRPIIHLFESAGRQPPAIPDEAHLVAYGHEIASLRSQPGLRLQAEPAGSQLQVEIVVERGVQLERPVHLCMGLFERHGTQNIRLKLTLEPGAQATLWSHCLFDTPLSARHEMDGKILIMAGAALHYQEAHFHGSSGDILVRPRARIKLEAGARLQSDFSLLQGRVGRLEVDYLVDVGAAAVAELLSRVYGHGKDVILLRERLLLSGAGARGLLKTRVAVRDDASASVLGAMEGLAAGARGHVDCMEVVRDRAVADAVPEVRVTHPQAKVTHEAAIGSVDARQLETLMARGLAPDEAVDLIVRGMLA